MNTDDTLSFFDTATAHLSHSVQKFQAMTCSTYQTMELPQESASCTQRHVVTFGLGRDEHRLKGLAEGSVNLLDESRSD